MALLNSKANIFKLIFVKKSKLHKLDLVDSVGAIINGRWQKLQIVGIALGLWFGAAVIGGFIAL